MDNLSRGTMSNLKEVHDKISFINLDITDYDRLRNAFHNVDGIFHQAALPSIPDSFKHEEEYRHSNITGTDIVFKIGLESQTRIVFASSSSVYGNVQTVPISEDSTRNPLSPYAVTKYEGELLAEKYIQKGAQIIALRYFNVVGIGRDLKYAGVIPKFLDKIKKGEPPHIFGDGSLIRDFVSVYDVVQANTAAMSGRTTYGFFNIGSGRPISIKDLAHMMIKISGLSLTPKYYESRLGDAKAIVANISKSKAQLGWEPSVSLEDSIEALFRIDRSHARHTPGRL